MSEGTKKRYLASHLRIYHHIAGKLEEEFTLVVWRIDRHTTKLTLKQDIACNMPAVLSAKSNAMLPIHRT